MILLGAVGLGVIVGLLRGGRLSRLADVPFTWGVWALLSLAAQLLVIQVPGEPGPGLRWWAMAGCYMLLLAVVWKNRRLPGMWIVGVGLLLNGVVILANGGAMPITPEMTRRLGVLEEVVNRSGGVLVAGAKDVILQRDQTRLWFLSDIGLFPVLRGIAFSVGDLLIAVGIVRLFDACLRWSPTTIGTGATTE